MSCSQVGSNIDTPSVDALARWGSFMAGIFVVFDQPPSSDILYLVNLDMAGIDRKSVV